ncbi:MAG TPA: hypothetical protein PL124_00230 [Candidatus Cloacimonadota bacterium]|nr:hypothetical protein [Candidatus Cloacimonadota bacterium]HPS37817.1 hypothetical protein [Candidatus Cloacimonadota bacterium]
MKKIVSVSRQVLFGEWNGIQVFLFPSAIFYWLDSFSFLFWMYELLSRQLHLLPLTLFLLVVAFLGFLLIKYHGFMNPNNSIQRNRQDFIRFILELHKGLLTVLLIAMVVFVVKTFLSYFYQIELPIKRIYSHFFQYIAIALIFFYYIQSVWSKPYRDKGMSYPRAINQVICFARKNIKETLIFTGTIIMAVLASALIYVMLIKFVLSPVLDMAGKLVGITLRFELIQVDTSIDLAYDVFMIFSSFVLSNLFFYPIIALTSKMIHKLHPIKIKVKNATQEN